MLTHLTDHSNLSIVDKLKFTLCKYFVKIAVKRQLDTKDLSDICKLPKTKVLEMSNYKIHKLNIFQLLINMFKITFFKKSVK